jgi:hypothetical protein
MTPRSTRPVLRRSAHTLGLASSLSTLVLSLLAGCSSAPDGGASAPEATRAPVVASSALAHGEGATQDEFGTPIIRICLDAMCSNSCATTPGVAGGSCQTAASGATSCVCDAPTCGGNLQPPCAGHYCEPGAHYDSLVGLCAHCGESGETCCNISSLPAIPDCYDGTACSDPGENDGRCEPCGGSGPACPSPTCGLIGQAPCPGNVCSQGHYDVDFNFCANCGTAGEQCCDVKDIGKGNNATECFDGTTCSGNMSLATGSTTCDAACGANGQPPCVGATPSSCQAGTVLNAAGTQCATCGGGGDPACAGGACNAGTILSGGECLSCGAANAAPQAGGCCAGLTGAITNYPGGNQICVSSCGAIGQLPCANGPQGTQNGEPLGGCTQFDAVMVTGSSVCSWPTTCGRIGQGCCDGGNAFQTPNGTGAYNQSGATQDVCHDGSECTFGGDSPFDLSWVCHSPSTDTGGGGAGTCPGGTGGSSYNLCVTCSGESYNESLVACSMAAAVSEQNSEFQSAGNQCSAVANGCSALGD